MHELLPRAAADSAELRVAHPQLTEFPSDWLYLQVTTDRFTADTGQAPHVRVRDLVVRVFKEHLHHTPLRALGINRNVHFRVGSLAERDRIGTALAPTRAGNWGGAVQILSFPPQPSPAGPRATLHALQEWEGYVVEVERDELVARLVDLTAGSTHEEEEAVIPLAEISECDVAAVRVGSIFRWVIGYERSPSGTKKRVSQIVFRDLPRMTFSRLREAGSVPTWAVANRRLFSRGACEIWSLAPADDAFVGFLRDLSRLVPETGQAETRIPSLSPNGVAVVLWITVGEIVVLLGSDLERGGWSTVVQDVARPVGRASVFKVPHHGSGSAHEPDVWEHMLDSEPFAVITPFWG